MKTVFICSPYRGNIVDNVNNAKKYARYAAMKGYAVFCPHLLYTQFLDDDVEVERSLGIDSGIEFLKKCDEVWVFAHDYDHCTLGMKAEINVCKDDYSKIRYIDPTIIFK